MQGATTVLHGKRGQTPTHKISPHHPNLHLVSGKFRRSLSSAGPPRLPASAVAPHTALHKRTSSGSVPCPLQATRLHKAHRHENQTECTRSLLLRWPSVAAARRPRRGRRQSARVLRRSSSCKRGTERGRARERAGMHHSSNDEAMYYQQKAKAHGSAADQGSRSGLPRA